MTARLVTDALRSGDGVNPMRCCIIGFRLRNRIALLAAVPVSINFSKLCPEQKYLG
jgi:hypothetical protein